MNSEQPSWILIEGGSPEEIRRAIIAHSELTRPEAPRIHRIAIFEIEPDRHGVTFEPSARPYDFINLINWLDDPRMTGDVRRAVGWLVAPGSGERYFLAPRRANAGGDALVGLGADGRAVLVNLPDGAVRYSEDPVTSIAEPELPDADTEPVARFEVTLDADDSFGNPQFEIE